MTASVVPDSRHREAAADRAGLWFHLARLLSFPDRPLRTAHARGLIARDVRECLDRLPYTLALATDDFAAGDSGALGPEYTRLFDLPGPGERPCPLYGGCYSPDRRQVMEELLRLYRHFGLTTRGAAERDLPDAIPTVLEFVGFLAAAEGARDASSAEAVRAAQRDLLARHVVGWIPPVRRSVDARDPHPLYRATLALADDYSSAELAALASSG